MKINPPVEREREREREREPTSFDNSRLGSIVSVHEN